MNTAGKYIYNYCKKARHQFASIADLLCANNFVQTKFLIYQKTQNLLKHQKINQKRCWVFHFEEGGMEVGTNKPNRKLKTQLNVCVWSIYRMTSFKRISMFIRITEINEIEFEKSKQQIHHFVLPLKDPFIVQVYKLTNDNYGNRCKILQ